VQQDSLARTGWDVVAHLLTERCIGMSVHQFCCPELIAGVNSSSPEEVLLTMKRWKRAWTAYVAAYHQKVPKLTEICQKNPMANRAVEAASRLAAASDWTCNETVANIGHVFFGGPGHTLWVERSNQKVRDAETRDSSSCAMLGYKCWDVPISAGILKSHDRNEVEPTMDMPAPRFETEVLFTPDHEDNAGIDFDRILGDDTWASNDALGRRMYAAETELLCHLHENDKFARVDDVWVSALLPKHAIVLDKNADSGTHKIYFVLLPSVHGTLVWSVHRCANTSLTLDVEGGHCEWVHIFDIANLFVVPIEPISPIHCFLQGNVAIPNMGVICNHSAPVPLLDYQAKVGFAGVPETVMKCLYAKFDLALPEPLRGADYECQLAMGLMEQVLPTLVRDDINRILRERTMQTELEGDGHEALQGLITSEIIEDCAGRAEKDFAKKHMTDARDSFNRKHETCKRIGVMIDKKFGGKLTLKPKKNGKG
jgi:hypothetical protein